MSEQLFLTKFDVKNFRCFGEFSFDFNPAPGVVILLGPNGLGKTSWFEAVEIALTGGVARWQDIKSRLGVDPLRVRHGMAKAEVNLVFGNGSSQESSLAWDSESGSMQQAIDLLCSNPHSWGLSPENIAGFLRATHLFPQSSSVRALHKAPKDRWEHTLRHISGFDQLSRLSDNLGKGVLTAVTQTVKDKTKKVLDRVVEIELWSGRVERFRSKERSLVSQGEILPPPEALSGLKLLMGSVEVSELIVNTPESARRLNPVFDIALGRAVRDTAEVMARYDVLVELKSLPTQWLGVTEELRLLEVSVSSKDATAKAAQAELDVARMSQTTLEDSLEESTAQRDSIKHKLETMDRLLEGQRRAHMARSGLSEANTRLETALQAKKSIEAKYRTALDKKGQRAEWDAACIRLRGRKGELKSAAFTLETIYTLEGKIAALTSSLTAIQEEEQAQERRCGDLERDSNLAAALHSKSHSELDQLRISAARINDAISQILEYLREDDSLCPVCGKEYTAMGDLLGRARESLTRANPALAIAEDHSRRAADSHRQFSVDLDRAKSERDNLRAEQSRVEREKAALLSELSAILDKEQSSGLSFQSIELELVQLDSQEATLLGHEPSFTVEEIETEIGALRGLNEAAQARVDEEHNWVRQSNSLLEELSISEAAQRATLEYPPRVTDDNLLRITIVSKLAESESRIETTKAALASAKSHLEHIETVYREKSSDNVREQAQLSQLKALAGGVLERWIDAGFTGEPDEQVLNGGFSRCQAKLAHNRELEQKIRGLRRKLDSWVEDAELNTERQELAAISGGPDDATFDARTAHLESRLSEARKLQDAAERARELAGKLADASQSKKETLYSTLQKDLGGALTQLVPLLLKDETFHDIVPSIESSKRSTSFSPRIAEGVQIEAVASEGQLSGLGFSVQLAMALSFPWSRWRGLLLDDPLQYSDIVHTSNLIEVLRLLALHHRFQIFLSTHDRDLADYVFRKFRNTGLSADRILFRESVEGTGCIPVKLR